MLEYIETYKQELLKNVLPFWMKYSKDSVHGGFLTSLDRNGAVFDSDKFLWLQGRQVWTFSMLFEKVEPNSDWLAMATHGADFLLKKGRDQHGNWYFALDRSGNPLVQPYNIFSDCFAAMGLGALYKIDPRDEYAQVARDTFVNILKRRTNPKGIYNKSVPGTRDLKGFALPMILSNLALELAHLLDKAVVEELLDEVIYEVMEVFYQRDQGLILEHVFPDGSPSDSFEGRLVNPGHVLEAMWFMMDAAERRKDTALIDRCIDIALRTADYGWDEKYGGLFYFMDIQDKPLQQLEWDQKLWWVHLEALVCMAKGWQLSKRKECKEWFEKLHSYTLPRFSDPEYGEWYGYLNRQGEVLLPIKGSKWKGCFHVPRALYQIYSIFQSVPIENSQSIIL